MQGQALAAAFQVRIDGPVEGADPAFVTFITHRWHHKHSDTPRDVHSARLRGFWYSHVGWVLRSEWSGRSDNHQRGKQERTTHTDSR